MKIISGQKKIRLPIGNSRKLKWGVAGCGRYLEKVFLPSLENVKRSKLISVYSGDLKRANYISEKFAAEKAFNDFSEFLKSDFQILYVSSVNSDHYWQVIEAAKAGKHILCEKPLAMNSKEAEEMIQVCNKNNVLFSVNYRFRFHPLVKKLKELIKRDFIGKIVHLNGSFNIDYSPRDNFRFEKEKSGGGPLRILGTHVIDLFNYLGGEMSVVSGALDNIVYKTEVEDFATATLKFDNAGYATITTAYNSGTSFNSIEVEGHKGSVRLENIFGRPGESGRLSINLEGEGRKTFRKKANSQTLLIKDIQNALQKGTQPLVSGTDGLINMKIMEQIEGEK